MAQKTTIIHSQLITTQNQTLLVPNTAVAEIVHYAAPQPTDNSPDWLLGTIEWRGRRVPIVSYERAAGDSPTDSNTTQRIAVLNGVSSGDTLQFYGIVIQGNPRLVNVAHDNIRKESNGDREKLQIQQVVVNDVAAVIPDLDRLENMITGAGGHNERVH